MIDRRTQAANSGDGVRVITRSERRLGIVATGLLTTLALAWYHTANTFQMVEGKRMFWKEVIFFSFALVVVTIPVIVALRREANWWKPVVIVTTGTVIASGLAYAVLRRVTGGPAEANSYLLGEPFATRALAAGAGYLLLAGLTAIAALVIGLGSRTIRRWVWSSRRDFRDT